MLTKAHEGALKELSEKGEGVAVIATLGVIDLDGDVTQPSAFGEQIVPMVFAHDWRSRPPIGKSTIREEGAEAVARFRLNLKTEGGREVYEALRFDLEQAPAKQRWSYGYSVIDAEKGVFENRPVRFLKKLQVHEISPVLVGASVGTRTVALKDAHWLTVEQAAKLCPPCAEKMRANGIKKVTLTEFVKQGGFQCPKPFATLEECVERVRNEPDIDDPEAFCAAWEAACEGKATMAEQLTSSLVDLKATVARMTEIRALRAQDGRDLSDARKAGLAEIRGLLGQIDQILQEPSDVKKAVQGYFALKERIVKGLDV